MNRELEKIIYKKLGYTIDEDTYYDPYEENSKYYLADCWHRIPYFTVNGDDFLTFLQKMISLGLIPHIDYGAYLNIDNSVSGWVVTFTNTKNKENFKASGNNLFLVVAEAAYQALINKGEVIYDGKISF
jgi:hypothetical protein